MQPTGPDANAKQLIAERIKQSTNILIAVSSDPSVDALSSALGLALMLNKMDKHATAVFSGQMPQAIQFLEPGKTFESTVDSLRDFIISLDKEKADRLRYKVEDDVVRIFITPYKTTITDKDLQFSQGDFNVELIVCLGVDKREDLDKAIVAHGRILHDATVVTVNANNQVSNLGAVDWHDPNASSLSEMLVGMSESFQKPGLIDAQIATALLTGIVASTNRFSNQRTTPRVMTMAAQMMAAGANQQLVANNLQIAEQPKPIPQTSTSVTPPQQTPKPEEAPKKDGELDITHDKRPKERFDSRDRRPKKTDQQIAEEQLAAALASSGPAPQAPTLEEIKSELQSPAAQPPAPQQQEPRPPKPPKPPKNLAPRKFISDNQAAVPGSQPVSATEPTPPPEPQGDYVAGGWKGRNLQPPTLGGTLNATAEQALEDKQLAEERDRNRKILTHNEASPPAQAAPAPTPEPLPELPPAPAEPPAPPVAQPQPPVPDTPAPQLPPEPALPPLPPLPDPTPVPEPPQTPAQPQPAPEPWVPPAVPEPPVSAPVPQPEPAPVSEPPALAPPSIDDLNAARKAVDDALASQPFSPAGQPLQSVAAQPMAQTPQPEQPAPEQQPVVNVALPPIPPMPTLPVHEPGMPPMPPSLPPLPADVPTVQPTPEAPAPPTAFEPPENQPQPPVDPGQYKIPGQ